MAGWLPSSAAHSPATPAAAAPAATPPSQAGSSGGRGKSGFAAAWSKLKRRFSRSRAKEGRAGARQLLTEAASPADADTPAMGIAARWAAGWKELSMHFMHLPCHTVHELMSLNSQMARSPCRRLYTTGSAPAQPAYYQQLAGHGAGAQWQSRIPKPPPAGAGGSAAGGSAGGTPLVQHFGDTPGDSSSRLLQMRFAAQHSSGGGGSGHASGASRMAAPLAPARGPEGGAPLAPAAGFVPAGPDDATARRLVFSPGRQAGPAQPVAIPGRASAEGWLHRRPSWQQGQGQPALPPQQHPSIASPSAAAAHPLFALSFGAASAAGSLGAVPQLLLGVPAHSGLAGRWVRERSCNGDEGGAADIDFLLQASRSTCSCLAQALLVAGHSKAKFARASLLQIPPLQAAARERTRELQVLRQSGWELGRMWGAAGAADGLCLAP